MMVDKQRKADRYALYVGYAILVAVVAWLAFDVDRQLADAKDQRCAVGVVQIETQAIAVLTLADIEALIDADRAAVTTTETLIAVGEAGLTLDDLCGNLTDEERTELETAVEGFRESLEDD